MRSLIAVPSATAVPSTKTLPSRSVGSGRLELDSSPTIPAAAVAVAAAVAAEMHAAQGFTASALVAHVHARSLTPYPLVSLCKRKHRLHTLSKVLNL
eukprot:161792-Chlamydomonas_euryale.AAC.2